MRLIEPFAGLAAYSLKTMALEHERVTRLRCRHEPPVSRMGNKAGFVPNVLKAWGLNRVRWSGVWMNDLDPVCHLFHMLYASSELRDLVVRRLWAMVPCPECLHEMREAAIDGTVKPTPAMCLEWLKSGTGKVEDPDCTLCSGTGVMDARQLWEKIRKAPVPGEIVEACAAGLYMQARSINGYPIVNDDGKYKVYLGDRISSTCFNPEEHIKRWGSQNPRPELASRVSSLPSGMASLADLTARALFMQSRSFQLKPVSIASGAWDEQGYKKEVDDLPRAPTSHAAGDDSPRWTVAERLERLPGWVEHGYCPEWRQDTADDPRAGGGTMKPRWNLANELELLPGPGGMSIRITRQDAALCLPTGDASECLVIADPPYVGTSGYVNDATRATVLEVARAWHDAGALVLIHEAVGLAGELGKGWLERPATVLRGRKSTFWGEGGEREWVTFNREPVWWPETQGTLF